MVQDSKKISKNPAARTPNVSTSVVLVRIKLKSFAPTKEALFGIQTTISLARYKGVHAPGLALADNCGDYNFLA